MMGECMKSNQIQSSVHSCWGFFCWDVVLKKWYAKTDCKSTALQHKGLSHLLFIDFLLGSHLHVLQLHFQIP